MKKIPYKIVSGASTSAPSSRELADWLAKDGQLLIPLVELLEKGERAIDEVIDVMDRATIEAVRGPRHSNSRGIASTPPRIASVCASIPPAKRHVRRASRLANSARNASGVTWSPCWAASRTASVIASAWSVERPAPVSRRAIA